MLSHQNDRSDKMSNDMVPPQTSEASDRTNATMCNTTQGTNIIDNLELPETLSVRINQHHEQIAPRELPPTFVLYLPTVVLRKEHNPAFALACRLANHYKVPLIVLAVVLDDAHMPTSSPGCRPIVQTSRRLAFLLEALQSATKEWSQHGAGVAIRVHGPNMRAPHHLSLATKATAVVTDEPFVHPFLGFVDTVERATKSAGVPCYRVDGSTTVPPVSKLQRSYDANGNTVSYKGVPAKAWMWQKKTDSQRMSHVHGAVRDGHLDAPNLAIKLDPNFFLTLDENDDLYKCIPADWKDAENEAPGRGPWTVEEIASITDFKQWALQWPGADSSLPPCQQTNGSLGQERWNHFRRKHLRSYAKLRNQVQKPHAVSRMSCYLNYGTVSIFQVIYDLWDEPPSEGTRKYADEIIKWREMSYAHAFAFPATYNLEAAVPEWSCRHLNQCRQQEAMGRSGYTLQQLEEGCTDCDKWNAMQQYLIRTGELHNNARMTWGKTVVHWQKRHLPVGDILQQLVYLNDRYALDGLSPPSYAGILWCFGWCDKPKDGRLSEKSSSWYRVSPTGFVEAEKILLSPEKRGGQRSITEMFGPKKKQKAS